MERRLNFESSQCHHQNYQIPVNQEQSCLLVSQNFLMLYTWLQFVFKYARVPVLTCMKQLLYVLISVCLAGCDEPSVFAFFLETLSARLWQKLKCWPFLRECSSQAFQTLHGG